MSHRRVRLLSPSQAMLRGCSPSGNGKTLDDRPATACSFGWQRKENLPNITCPELGSGGLISGLGSSPHGYEFLVVVVMERIAHDALT
jgi:hypothetical protein